MTAKISVAMDDEGKYVKIADAVKGQVYYCLNCMDGLFPSKGQINIHHYRHFTKKDKDSLVECELYSPGDSYFDILFNEQIYENKIRFIIDKSLKFNIKLPYLGENFISKMNYDDLYFSIWVQNNRIFSTDLGKRSNRSYLEVPLEYEYIIEIENERNAQLLKYEIEKNVHLFHRKTVLFKKTGGEFINIPYERTNISEELFLLSKNELSIHDDLRIKGHSIIRGIHIYHFYVKSLTGTLIRWFKKETGYIIIPNRKWIDLVSPKYFQYNEHSTLIDSEKACIKITPHSNRDVLSYLDKDGRLKLLKVNENGIAELSLERDYIYHLRLNHEICNDISLQRICVVEPTTDYSINVLINDYPYTIGTRDFKHTYSIKSANDFFVFFRDQYPFSTKILEKQLPNAVHFPYIGTIYKGIKKNKDDFLNWNLLFNAPQWDVVKNSEFMDVLKNIQQSNVSNSSIYIGELLKNFNKLPREFIKIIRGGH